VVTIVEELRGVEAVQEVEVVQSLLEASLAVPFVERINDHCQGVVVTVVFQFLKGLFLRRASRKTRA